MSTKYSVFVSSAYQALKEERSYVIDAVTKLGHFPIAMEYISFGSFEEIKKLIRDSDAVILLLGSEYGTTDGDGANGVSWTEREFEYAESLQKHIFALELPSLSALRKKPRKTALEKKQMAFVDRVNKKTYLCPVNDRHEYYEKISTHFNSLPDKDLGSGWVRATNYQEWKKNHPWMDLDGTWYSFHVSETDKNYLKIGTVTIEQGKDVGTYRELNVQAINYKCRFSPEKEKITERYTTSTSWSADYEIYSTADGKMKEIRGIFVATKNADEKFADVIIEKGMKMGIHIFDSFEQSKDGKIKVIRGRFSNTNVEKEGLIVLFKKIKDRDQCLRTDYYDRLNANKE